MKVNYIKNQQGFLLIVAIFVLLVLSALSVSMLSLYKNYSLDSARELQYQRAYYAAKSAIELAYREAAIKSRCVEQEYNFDASLDALNGFKVKVTCHPIPHHDLKKYEFTAIAEYGSMNEPYFVRRTVQKRF